MSDERVLTPRQQEVAGLVSRGMSYKAVAQEMDISVRTVVNHVQNAAHRIDGDVESRPRDRVTIWFLTDPTV